MNVKVFLLTFKCLSNNKNKNLKHLKQEALLCSINIELIYESRFQRPKTLRILSQYLSYSDIFLEVC